MTPLIHTSLTLRQTDAMIEVIFSQLNTVLDKKIHQDFIFPPNIDRFNTRVLYSEESSVVQSHPESKCETGFPKEREKEGLTDSPANDRPDVPLTLISRIPQ